MSVIAQSPARIYWGNYETLYDMYINKAITVCLWARLGYLEKAEQVFIQLVYYKYVIMVYSNHKHQPVFLIPKNLKALQLKSERSKICI